MLGIGITLARLRWAAVDPDLESVRLRDDQNVSRYRAGKCSHQRIG